ncbi:MAG TPA: hypothetical protein PKE39_03490 [Ignavibacteria bacterium]|nr:hypothetical protein [Ignavibacteria bacterium]HMQ98065.1 hypothetical protein [Ignavibacteria bacterium]
MRKPRTEKEKADFLELREKREKISKEMKKLNPEELKAYIAERLNQKKELPENN